MRTISPRFLNKSYFLESSAEYLFSILSVNGINAYLPYGHIFWVVFQKRNAVAIGAWLWKDNKIPYVIDKSEFGRL